MNRLTTLWQARSRQGFSIQLVFSMLMVMVFAVTTYVFWAATSTASNDFRTAQEIVNADLIRVGISDDAMTAMEYPLTRISGTGGYTVTDQSNGNLVFKGSPKDILTITVNRQGFMVKPNAGMPKLSDVPFTGPLLVQPDSPDSRLRIMNITRRKEIPEFRGTFEIVRGYSAPNKLTVVNVVTLEDYLKAVVPNELPMRYGEEAVKAQSVAARNYAIRPREKPWPTFDICDSQYCQVYLGSQTETPGTNRVIADTQGLVAVYEGEPVLALFSSSHGGYAEDYSNAFSDPKTKQFPAPAIPYLKGGPDVDTVKGDLSDEAQARAFWTNRNAPSYDVESPYYRWEKRWTRTQLEQAVNKGLLEVSKDTSTRDFVSPLMKPGQTIGTFKRVNVLQRGKSGKAMVLEIAGTNGTWTVKKEFLIRKVFTHDGRMLPSGNVVFSHLTDPRGNLVSLVANGGGFGHGVGMSQLGASWMHAHGYGFPSIIQHYYKGASLGSMPVSVGQGHPNRPVKTSFYAKKAQGVLWIQSGDRANRPVSVQLNGEKMLLTPTGERTAFPVSPYLKAHETNTLILYPDQNRSERLIKAWVDLYPAKPAGSG